LKSRASPDMLPFSLCKKKRLASNSAQEQTLLSNDTIDSILLHWEVSRAKDLLAPPRIRLSMHKPRVRSRHGDYILYFDA